MLTTLGGHRHYHRKPFHAAAIAAARRSLVPGPNGSGSRKFIKLRLHPAFKATMRIVLHRIAVTNPSILQAGQNLRNEGRPTLSICSNAIMAPRHMQQSREIIKTSSVKRGFSPRFPHNRGDRRR
ncbi:hypothetical protein IE4803_CH00871 [Rhizobium etli bv. phaseoli str. IE4803]|nr:hypothetical protein IE4803_CH00871 [Rhizobium etli bv. phaseoli str. IE4803]